MTTQGDLALMHANGATFAQVLDAHAHLLAEQQRAFDGPSMTMAGNRMVPLDMITALIDPEVSDAPQEDQGT